MMKNGVFYFWNIFSCFQDVFVKKISLITSQNVYMPVINSKIENISENIGWMLFILGISNVHLIMPKVTPINKLFNIICFL